MNSFSKRDFGKKGEEAVCEWLKRNGYTIKTINFTTRFGEIDIVACKKPVVACIEVKTRLNPLFPISLVITPSKQRKIIASAKLLLAQEDDYEESVCRFDVALVTYENNQFVVEYIENAFCEESR